MPANQPSFASRLSLTGAGVFILFCSVAAVAILFSRWHPWLDLFTHMTWHLFWGVCAVSLGALIAMLRSQDEVRRGWRIRLYVSLGGSVLFCSLAKPWEAVSSTDNDPAAEGIRMLSWNVLLTNTDLSEMEQSIKEFQPDVIVLIELDSQHESFVSALSKDYPYCEWTIRGAAGLGVFSKIAGTKIAQVDLAELSVPAMEIEIPAASGGAPLHALAVHTYSPAIDPDRTWLRNLQLEDVANWVERKGARSVVLGDLNITPWSYPFQELLREARLKDTRVGRGLFPTWPSVFGLFGIPIDHALVTEDLTVGYRGLIHRPQRSDHRGIALVVE